MPAHCAEVDTEEFYLHQGVSEESMQDERPPNVTQQIQPRQTDVAAQLAVQQTQVQTPRPAQAQAQSQPHAQAKTKTDHIGNSPHPGPKVLSPPKRQAGSIDFLADLQPKTAQDLQKPPERRTKLENTLQNN